MSLKKPTGNAGSIKELCEDEKSMFYPQHEWGLIHGKTWEVKKWP